MNTQATMVFECNHIHFDLHKAPFTFDSCQYWVGRSRWMALQVWIREFSMSPLANQIRLPVIHRNLLRDPLNYISCLRNFTFLSAITSIIALSEDFSRLARDPDCIAKRPRFLFHRHSRNLMHLQKVQPIMESDARRDTAQIGAEGWHTRCSRVHSPGDLHRRAISRFHSIRPPPVVPSHCLEDFLGLEINPTR
ncbi:hypothetical protein BDP55DRAFT_6671 [Colletotrichum godetiae]|uniref:Uncharacterized protein n=1 Tax=Colletotrichum godetiae TaxID=1209918 RepID=A0AAJ0B1P6_9PEZI|nr:uncharacterized protein BDP55DRAFT_6671 [Colletotrichum godetiae]KAK1701001.1 hypothetical protein BDP55DRAFT_6671 [Colletotrichum godetiae]